MSPPCFLSRFKKVAYERPDAVAVLDGGRVALTYGELLESAERVAGNLQDLGAGEDVLVGLAIEKSPNYLIGLLGVWFAGAAFLPLDPHGASERYNFMLGDSNPALLLGSKGCRENLPDLKAKFVDIDDAQRRPGSFRAIQNNPESLAYVIYSSGSTGQPKGIEVPHRGIVNLLEAQISAFDIGPGDRALFFLSQLFDAALSDIGTALLSGATLCLESRTILENISSLGRVLRERRITHLDFPPSFLGLLDPRSLLGSLRTLVIGGETCPPELLRRWAKNFRVINVYGPTEATVCASLCEVDARSWFRPFIGHPIPNVVFRLLGPDLVPVSPGEVAELFIGGMGLARGYLNLPELNQSRFVDCGGERLFRTGDRVIQRPDGEIEILGRWDRQVKLNGILVSPEEVETSLRSHPQVSQAAVVPKIFGKRKMLQAYLSLKEDADSESLARIQESLKKCLPGYMLPRRWEVLEKLPKTPSGKIDLPVLEALPARIARVPKQNPNTPLEVILSSICKQVLGYPTLGAHENFFEAGADSLAVIEIIAMAEQHSLRVTPEMLFAHPTIAGLASALDHGDSGDVGVDAQELRDNVAFDPEWRELLNEAKARPMEEGNQKIQDIFLTGVTGFLGSLLLWELMKGTSANLYCLLRAENRDHGMRRVLSALGGQGIEPSPREMERVQIVLGDLAEVCLGISGEEWKRLGERIDTVYHCGAETNLLSSYKDLFPTNVGGTREILRLLCEGRRKILHYVSTLSVFVGTDRNRGDVLESDNLQNTSRIYGGYAQTKWAAEVFLRNSQEYIDSISFYRLGLLTPNCGGSFPQRDWLGLILRGILSLGSFPAIPGCSPAFDVTPVDYAARAIAHLSLIRSDERATTYHIANPGSASLEDLADCFGRAGRRLKRLPLEEWNRRILQRLYARNTPEEVASLLALHRCFAGYIERQDHRLFDLFQATGVRFDTSLSQAVLAGKIPDMPSASELLTSYVQTLLKEPGVAI